MIPRYKDPMTSSKKLYTYIGLAVGAVVVLMVVIGVVWNARKNKATEAAAVPAMDVPVLPPARQAVFGNTGTQ